MKVNFLVRLGMISLFSVGLARLAAAIDPKDSVITAVFSRSLNGYERPVRADGSPEVQTYVVAKGGYIPGFGADPSIDDVKFAGIVRVLGKYLAKQGYYPAKDAKKADLMLIIHWGKTIPGDRGLRQNLVDQGLRGFETMQQMGLGIGRSPGDLSGGSGLPPMAGSGDSVGSALNEAAQQEMIQGLFEIRFAEDMRVSADEYNANLLGYTADLKYRGDDAPPSLYAGAGTAYYDLRADVESERYYIAITALDFQDLVKHQHKKGLWRTVASIDARDNRFDERLALMVDKASHYFGKDTKHLVRDFEYTPHVSFGELKVLGVVEDKPGPKK